MIKHVPCTAMIFIVATATLYADLGPAGLNNDKPPRPHHWDNVPLPEAIKRIDLPGEINETRADAVRALSAADIFGSHEVATALLQRLNDAEAKPLSEQGEINCLIILSRRADSSWTEDQVAGVKNVLDRLKQRHLSSRQHDAVSALEKAMHRMLAKSAVSSASVPLKLDTTPISTLEVRIQTTPNTGLSKLPDLQNIPGVTKLPKAGAKLNESDDVYLDLGPHAWNLGHDFPPGQEVRKTLDVAAAHLSESDITQVRLEKKGILGFTNAPDSFLNGVGYVPSVATAVGMLRRSVQTQAYVVTQAEHVLSQKQSALDIANNALDGAAKAAADAEAIVADAERHLSDLNQQITGLTRRIHDIVGDLAAKATSWIPILGDAVDKLNKEKKELEQTVDKAQGEVAEWTIQKEQALRNSQIKAADKAAKLQLKITVETEYTLAKATADSSLALLNECQQKLVDVEAIAQKLPSVNLFPTTTGEWEPREVTVFVNGKAIGPFQIGERLKRFHYAWMKVLGNYSDSERFARGLRTELPPPGVAEQGSVWNAILKHPEKILDHPDLFTTEFKNEDISGWEDYPKDRPHVPIGTATVRAKLVRPPSEGTDANVSLDLEVQSVAVNGATIGIDAEHGFQQTRYIRIEYQFGTDRRFDGWHVNDILEVQGRVRWDTDHEGFFELHPAGVRDVNKL